MSNAHETQNNQRTIQDAQSSGGDDGQGGRDRPVQTGARAYPAPPFPKQHQSNPGDEAKLDPPPMFDAPYYEGSNKLKDKVALITGGDSGIGRAVAVLFAREGADVSIVYLNEDEDAKETQRAVEKEGRRCVLMSGDVSDRSFCLDVVDKTIKSLGKLDVLVNNAAFQLHVDRFEDLTAEHFDKTLKTNLYGYFYMAQAAAGHLPYGAPGPVWSPLNPADKDADDISQFGAKTVMKRPAQPEEIAPAFVFLASSHCSSYITGEVLPIIGGYQGG